MSDYERITETHTQFMVRRANYSWPKAAQIQTDKHNRTMRYKKQLSHSHRDVYEVVTTLPAGSVRMQSHGGFTSGELGSNCGSDLRIQCGQLLLIAIG